MNLAHANIGQLLIPVEDLQQGIAFYRDQLGLPLLFTAPPQMAFFQCGAVRLLVGVMPVGEVAQRGAAIYFSVADIHATYAELNGRAVAFRAAPHVVHRTPLAELWLAEFTDPCGNQLALMGEIAVRDGTAGVRPATFEDAAEIARLANELGYRASAADIAARLALMRSQRGYLIVVAEAQAGKLTGWVCAERRLVLEGGEQIEISGLVIDVTARRRGIGKALLAEVERWAQQQGLTLIVVRSNIARPESHLFYPGAGYSRLKTQHVYVKDNAVDGRAQPS